MMRRVTLKQTTCGFTLIEMITVIVILSILAAMGGTFVVESTKSYQSSQTRSRLVNTGRQAIERMTRQLRIALPYSLRITNSGMCVEFMPLASGGNYSGAVPDLLNGAPASNALTVSPHTIDFGEASFVSVGAMATSELYGVNPGARATLSARTNTHITLSAAKVWQRNSLQQRFYLLNKPQAFCVVNQQLRFYDNQLVADAGVDLNSSFSLLADNVSAATPFALTAGSENRNTQVQFNLTFARLAESIAFNHLVMIRNVP
jgi:MSHA biogenesis protein MshO